MKIGIISINAHTKVLNPASPLHTYAFWSFLKDNGIDSTIIDYKPVYYGKFDVRHPLFYYAEHPMKDYATEKKKLKKWKNLFYDREKRYDRFEEFIQKYYVKTEKCYTAASVEKEDPGFDCYMCVTDVIWKYNPNNGFDRGFLLAANTFKGKKKIAYAASRGANGYTQEQGMTFFDYISDIDYISVREKSLKEYIEHNSDIPVSHVIDPVFLREKEFYYNLAITPPKKEYVLVYLAMERAIDLVKNAVAFAKERGLEVIELSEEPEDANIPEGTHHEVIYDIGVEEWLGYMQNAAYIFTNSFHACCFSIIFGKQFYVGKRAGDKIDSLLEMFNLSWRRIPEYDIDFVDSIEDIDWQTVNVLKREYIESSSKFILDAIYALEQSDHQNHKDLVHREVYMPEKSKEKTPYETDKKASKDVKALDNNINRGNKKKAKVNIVLVEIINRNLGDAVIADTTYYLLQKALPFWTRDKYNICRYDILSQDYELISRADMVIFAGGGIIKYKIEDFYRYVSKILDCANEHDIPVYFNAVGVEGYDSDDEKCRLLKKALRQSCVKGISVRDDLNTLKQYYIEGTDIAAYDVVDPVVFADETYKICKKHNADTVGIVIVRHNIFSDYGIPEIDKEFQLKMWKSLIEELENRGHKWKLFVNGLKSDFDFAEEILEYIGKAGEKHKYLVPRPTESRELVETIASFKCVVACRMHANIIAYSLGIPSVGLVWNDKLTFWGERIGYAERFLAKEHFTGTKIADCVEKSISEGVRQHNPEFKRETYRRLKEFVRKYGKDKQRSEAWNSYNTEWQDKLLATALGGLHLKYRNMNSSVTVENSIKNGFKYLEADIRLTSDNIPVCVNGWSQKTYDSLGISEGKYDKSGMSYAEFMKCKYYNNHYPTMDLEQLLKIMQIHYDCTLILDIGIPSKDKADKYRDEIFDIISKYNMQQNCIIRLQTERDVKLFRELPKELELMYFYPEKTEKEYSVITAEEVGIFSRDNGIKWTSVSIGNFNRDMAVELKKYGQNICVFSCKTAGEIVRAVKDGADLVGTYYVTVNNMNSLFGDVLDNQN